MITAKEAKSLLQTKTNFIDSVVDEQLNKIDIFIRLTGPATRMCDVELVIDNKISDSVCKMLCIKLFGLGYGTEIIKTRRGLTQDNIDLVIYW